MQAAVGRPSKRTESPHFLASGRAFALRTLCAGPLRGILMVGRVNSTDEEVKIAQRTNPGMRCLTAICFLLLLLVIGRQLCADSLISRRGSRRRSSWQLTPSGAKNSAPTSINKVRGPAGSQHSLGFSQELFSFWERYKLVLEPPGLESLRQWMVEDSEGNVSIFAFFDRRALTDSIDATGRLGLALTGRLATGRYIYGCDTIRVIRPPQHRPTTPTRHRKR